jgi:hypothetical protein
MIAFRHSDGRFPFLWEDANQPSARWHREGEGPVQYLADTPDGAWAEFLRHEEITDEIDLEGISRALWAVSITDENFVTPLLTDDVVRGGTDSYEACQDEAARLRAAGATAIRAGSAALERGAAGGWRVEAGLRPGADADGQVLVLFGTRPDATGWLIVDHGRPAAQLLPHVRPL